MFLAHARFGFSDFCRAILICLKTSSTAVRLESPNFRSLSSKVATFSHTKCTRLESRAFSTGGDPLATHSSNISKNPAGKLRSTAPESFKGLHLQRRNFVRQASGHAFLRLTLCILRALPANTHGSSLHLPLSKPHNTKTNRSSYLNIRTILSCSVFVFVLCVCVSAGF